MPTLKAHQIFIQPNPSGNPCLIITDEKEQGSTPPYALGSGPVRSDNGAGCRKRIKRIDTIEWFGDSNYTTTIDFGSVTPLANGNTIVTIDATNTPGTWISSGVYNLNAIDGERYKYSVRVTDRTGNSIIEDPQVIIDCGGNIPRLAIASQMPQTTAVTAVGVVVLAGLVYWALTRDNE
jgi:hypothetical protein